MKQKINTFYILNLLSIVDGEILESAHVDISKYIYLDISTCALSKISPSTILNKLSM